MSTIIHPTGPPQPEAVPVHPAPPATPPSRNGPAQPPPEVGSRPASARRARQLRLTKAALGVVVGLLLLGGILRWFRGSDAAGGEISATVVRADLPIIVTERGTLESSVTVDTFCEVEGLQNKIVTLLPEGKAVKKDDVVVTLDTDQLNRQCADQEVKAKTAEGKAKAAKGELEVEKNKVEGEIAKARLALVLAELDRDKYLEGEYLVLKNKMNGEIELAKRELQDAEEKLAHFRTYVKKGFGTPEQQHIKEMEIEQKKYALRSKEAELMVLEKFTRKRQETELNSKADETKRELERAQKSGAAALEKAQSTLEADEAAARTEKATLERFQRQLERCKVRAPGDGILVYGIDDNGMPGRKIQPGMMVHFQQLLFSLPELTQMQVKVKIHESMVKKVQPGQKAEILVEAYTNTVLHGTVESVATLADSMGPWDERGVKEYVTIVKIDDLPTGAGLKPGMSAQVKIQVAHLPSVLMVPVQAVAERDGQHYCYVRSAMKGLKARPVTVGENNDKFVEIKEGVDEGEQVMLDARARSAAEAKASEQK
jgi:RND family efflux transporter MFP subunit